jgi:hypothetical protein
VSASPARFILAFPRGNTGIATYFVPSNPSTPLAITLENQTLASVSNPDSQVGITGNLVLSSDITFGVTISELMFTIWLVDRLIHLGLQLAASEL